MTEAVEPPLNYSRRQIVTAFKNLVGSAASRELDNKLGRYTAPDPAPANREGSYARTLTETGLLAIGQIVTKSVIESMGKKQRSVPMPSKSMSLLDRIATEVVLGPLLEESLLRWLPSEIVDRVDSEPGNKHWEVGIPISVIFALLHISKKQQGETPLNTVDVMPYKSFIMGIYYWYLTRERGIEHTAVSHMSNNALATSLSLLLEKVYPNSPILKKALG